jgi:hypothetical protein
MTASSERTGKIKRLNRLTAKIYPYQFISELAAEFEITKRSEVSVLQKLLRLAACVYPGKKLRVASMLIHYFQSARSLHKPIKTHCEWHLKIQPDRDRIHFHFGVADIGSGRIFIGIFCYHLK